MQAAILERLDGKLDAMKVDYETVLNRNQIYINKIE
jgi:hypothetical protein